MLGPQSVTSDLQEFLLGEWSCLHVVLDLIDSKQQGKYWCPPLLHRAALAFLLALWQDRRDSAISVLRKKYGPRSSSQSPLSLHHHTETIKCFCVLGRDSGRT